MTSLRPARSSSVLVLKRCFAIRWCFHSQNAETTTTNRNERLDFLVFEFIAIAISANISDRLLNAILISCKGSRGGGYFKDCYGEAEMGEFLHRC